MSSQPPYESKFPALEAPNVVPKAFKGTWEGRVGEWGLLLKQAYVHSVLLCTIEILIAGSRA